MTTPAYPPSPMNTYPPAAPLSPPGTIKAAFLIYVLAALVAVAGAVLLITSSAFDDAITANSDAVTTSGLTISQVANTAKIIAIVAAVILSAFTCCSPSRCGPGGTGRASF